MTLDTLRHGATLAPARRNAGANTAALDIYRLHRHVQQAAAQYEAERGPWPQVSDTCIGCHGVNGRPLNPHYPPLAAQPAAYLAAQLRAYAEGRRVHPIMNAMARALDDHEIETLAAFFARQRAGDPPVSRLDPLLLERGQQIVEAGACTTCHGESLSGRDSIPRIAGLGYDYVLKQLDAYAAGTRRDPSQAMNTLAASWTPQQRQAIAAFLASRSARDSTAPSERGEPQKSSSPQI
ncbi:c-type cytochrome [Fontimonas thermophila]|nr:c-type cytochrome [Fontimonas thermophila]